jgi:hypothetical protein
MLLMAARRAITFYDAVAGDFSQPPNLSAELVALLISGLCSPG